METTTGPTMGGMPLEEAPLTTLPPRDELAPDMQRDETAQGIKDRAEHLTQGAKEMGSKILHATIDRAQQLPAPPEEKKGLVKGLIACAVAVGGLGLAIRQRHQQSKSRSTMLVEKAKGIGPQAKHLLDRVA